MKYQEFGIYRNKCTLKLNSSKLISTKVNLVWHKKISKIVNLKKLKFESFLHIALNQKYHFKRESKCILRWFKHKTFTNFRVENISTGLYCQILNKLYAPSCHFLSLKMLVNYWLLSPTGQILSTHFRHINCIITGRNFCSYKILHTG